MRKAIIFLGVSDLNWRIVEIAKKVGYLTVCVNKNKDSLSLKKADFPKVVDSNDVVSVIDFVFSIKPRLDVRLVYSGGEFFVAKEALSSVFELESNPMRASIAAQNKQLMRKLFVSSKVSMPKGETVSSKKEARDASKKLRFPIILKPNNKLGGLGVCVSRGLDDFDLAYRQASQYSRNIIVERFYDGTFHDVNGFFHKGKFYQAGISDKIPSGGQYKYIEGLSCPSFLSESQKNDLYRLLEESAKAIGVSVGPVKGDAILTDEGFLMMEIALRFHGPLSSLYCLPFAEGTLPFEYYLSVIEGKKYAVKHPKGYVYIGEIKSDLGIIKKISSVEEAKRIKGVQSILLNKSVGDRVKKVKSNYDILGYVHICSDNKESALDAYRTFGQTFKVIVS